MRLMSSALDRVLGPLVSPPRRGRRRKEALQHAVVDVFEPRILMSAISTQPVVWASTALTYNWSESGDAINVTAHWTNPDPSATEFDIEIRELYSPFGTNFFTLATVACPITDNVVTSTAATNNSATFTLNFSTAYQIRVATIGNAGSAYSTTRTFNPAFGPAGLGLSSD